MSTSIERQAARLDLRDQEYVAQLEPEARPVVVSALVRHRRQPGLEVGDALPELAGIRLDDGERVLLGSLVDARPSRSCSAASTDRRSVAGRATSRRSTNDFATALRSPSSTSPRHMRPTSGSSSPIWTRTSSSPSTRPSTSASRRRVRRCAVSV